MPFAITVGRILQKCKQFSEKHQCVNRDEEEKRKEENVYVRWTSLKRRKEKYAFRNVGGKRSRRQTKMIFVSEKRKKRIKT